MRTVAWTLYFVGLALLFLKVKDTVNPSVLKAAHRYFSKLEDQVVGTERWNPIHALALDTFAKLETEQQRGRRLVNIEIASLAVSAESVFAEARRKAVIIMQTERP